MRDGREVKKPGIVPMLAATGVPQADVPDGSLGRQRIDSNARRGAESAHNLRVVLVVLKDDFVRRFRTPRSRIRTHFPRITLPDGSQGFPEV
jgi:hypothetical protein